MNLNELIKTFDVALDDIDENNEALVAELESLGGTIESNIDNLCRYIQHREQKVESIDKEIARLKARKEQIEKKTDGISNWLSYCIGDKKIETSLFKVYVKPSKVTVIVDESLIPPAYMVVKVVETSAPDKMAIKKDIELGATIPGAMVKTNTNLIIK